MRLLHAVSSLCCFAALSLIAPGCGITILGKGTDADEQSGGGSGTAAGVGAGSGVGGGDPCLPGIPVTSQIPRLLDRQYDAVVRDLLGVTTLASAGDLPPSALLVPDFEGDMTDPAWNGYLAAAEHVAAEVMGGPNKPTFLACDPAAPTCLEETIITFGRKAFRRPLLEEEVQSLLRLTAVEPRGTPDEIAEAILFAFLASPSFLMRPELTQDREGDAIKLSSHEVAARLSFLLWDSIPDDILDAAADAGQLATKAQILAQAQRMIQDREKTAPVVAQFHRVYADIRTGSRWGAIEHDTTRFPDYSPDVVAPMMAEMDALFEDVAFEGGAFKDLFLSNVGYVNQDTAPLYGLDAADYGAELTRVELDPNERPGFLTRVGFLSSYSRYDATNPILRGAFVSTRLLGVNLAPVPGASETPRPPGEFSTEREVVDALTSSTNCAVCHDTYVNPPGFVLERYDAVGKVQTIDPLGGAIDGTADVTFGANNVKRITSPIELMNELAADPGARRHYAERWVAFATGRAPNGNDACDVDGLSASLSVDGYTLLDLLTDLTQTDSFRLRVVGD
ncbi:DUF1592 domain-containing protein [Sorangium atrum]|uniref:DUF1592 domain-containing protein n=1 Tax=Sorangium atrum TaxID=2995308 RepID=A0ABT5BTT4_9BACT|nr:DUF1592 domain-containing protein [Sorangium aterium]MDC0677582.1 DUF1592 domain-containing protein [Sorangium aterium]